MCVYVEHIRNSLRHVYQAQCVYNTQINFNLHSSLSAYICVTYGNTTLVGRIFFFVSVLHPR